MPEAAAGRRPKHLNLAVIRLPLPGVVSILHRASGLYLIAALPFLTWALAVAVRDAAGYGAVASVMGNPLVKILMLGVIWSVMHHLCAGIRFLLIEVLIGIELPAARAASWAVMAVSLLGTAALGWALLL